MATIKSAAGSAQVEIRDKNEHLQRHWAKGAFYEASMLEWIHRHHRGGTFIDCGSSIGNHSLYFARFCADRVLSVEPVMESAAHQLESVILNDLQDRVDIVQKALGAGEGKCTMVPFAPDGHNNVGMHKVAPGDDVEMTTLDTLVSQFDLDDVTLVKIDVEFSELEALRGAENLLREQKPALFVEVTDDTERAVKNYLAQFGYMPRSQHNVSPTIEFVVPGWKQRLNILGLSEWDFAGCGYFLSDAINTTTIHQSRAVRWRDMALDFPHDILRPSDKELRRLWEWADVVHIHDTTSELPRGLPLRPTVVTYHGTNYRRSPQKYNEMLETNGWIGTVATHDLTRWGLPLLPDCRPDLSAWATPSDSDGFTVCHAPAKKNDRRKGTYLVIVACRKAGVKLDLIQGQTWADCIKRKGRADLLIDQFTISYGCNAIEAWLTGLPVISGVADPVTLEPIRHNIGHLPFYNCKPNVDAIADAIARLRDDEDLYTEYVRRGADCVKRFHSYEAVANRAIGFYRQAYERGARRAVKPLSTRKRKKRRRPTAGLCNFDLVLLRYLGKNVGAETWYGDETNTHYIFSAERREGYVYEPDVQWFVELQDKKGKHLFERG